jgi:putative membrane protein
MAETEHDSLAEARTSLAEERTDLALRRTVIAGERTLMAWIRTVLAMISFGFGLYTFLGDPGAAVGGLTEHQVGVRNFGLALVSLGTLALVAAIIQHFGFLRELRSLGNVPRWTLTVTVALVTVVLGVLGLAGIVFDVGPF